MTNSSGYDNASAGEALNDKIQHGDYAVWGIRFRNFRKNKAKEVLDYRQTKRRRGRESVLTMEDDVGIYKPKGKESRDAYEAMLGLIQRELGGQPLSVVIGAADEVLGVLKDEGLGNVGKREGIERLLGRVTDNVFDRFVGIGRGIDDYGGCMSLLGGCDCEYSV